MPDKQPNILILFTDQQRFDTIAAAGYSHMKTPNLDRLIREGCLFTNAYSPNPVCVPARHSLITGQVCSAHGFFSNAGKAMIDDGLPTLPGMLAENDYFTAAVGKMHFRPFRNHNGFMEMHLMEEIPRHRGDDAYATYLAEQGYEDVRAIHGVRPLIYHEPQRAVMPEEHHGEAWVAKRAIEVLDREQDRPFFMMCGFIKPHPPFNIPDDWLHLYDGVDLPAAIPGPREEPYFTAESDWFGDNDTEEEKRAIRAAYYTSISFVDHQIGKILDYLEKRGILDDTVIIFTADHGEMLQDHGLYQKSTPFESAAHIPFIVRAPEHVKPGSTDGRFVDLLDILPTVLDVTGIDFYEKECRKRYTLPGDSIFKQESDHRDRAYQVVQNGAPPQGWMMIRDARYKYIWFGGGGFERLYDLQEDPQELRNLVGTPDLPETDFNRLKQKLIEWVRVWGPAESLDGDGLLAAPHNPPKHARGMGKFPLWANEQMPMMGREGGEREAELLIQDTKTAVVHKATPGYFRDVAPEPFWCDHWKKKLLERGGTEEQAEGFLGS